MQHVYIKNAVFNKRLNIKKHEYYFIFSPVTLLFLLLFFIAIFKKERREHE